MARTIEWVKRPAPTTDHRAPSNHHRVGLAIALAGVVAVLVAAAATWSAAGDLATDPAGAASTRAWSFGVTVAGFGTVKTAIAVVLVGILLRLWLRVDSLTHALGRLKGRGGTPVPTGPFDSPWGTGRASATPPPPLRVHTMARALWLPMLAMGAMAVLAGLVTSFVASEATSGESVREAAAWSQGLLFLGETLLLSGISFLLGTILAGLRQGGAEVQSSAGVTVRTLDMPASAKAFLALMAVGMMIGIVQFAFYVHLATTVAADAASFAGWAAWLGPFREAGLGVLLSGIVLALYTISTVLGFQFSRIRDIVATGA